MKVLNTYWAVIFLTAYLSTIYAITLNKHFHVTENGDVINHVHPLKKDCNNQAGNHSHSSDDTFYFHCNILDFQEPAATLEHHQASILIEVGKTVYSSIHFFNNNFCAVSLRAPPVG